MSWSPPETDFAPRTAIRWLMIAIALIALAISTVLLSQELTAGIALPGCGTGSGCDVVFQSGWGQWFGVPVGIFAVAMYLLILGALLNIGLSRPANQRRLAWCVLFFGATAIAVTAVWMICLQVFVIGAICKYCMTVHACGLILATLIAYAAVVSKSKPAVETTSPSGDTTCRRKAASLLTAVPIAIALGLAGAIILAAGEAASRPATSRIVGYGDIAINIDLYPVIGSRHAKHILVLFADYTCPFCRRMHGYLDAALKAFGTDQLAVAIAPMPLDAMCNPYVRHTEPIHEGGCELAKIALAVWRIKPDAFPAMDHWLFAADHKRTVVAALAKAGELVGSEAKIQAVMHQPWTSRFLLAQAHLNYALGQAAEVDGQPVGDSIPKLIFPGSFMEVGLPNSQQAFFKELENRLHIKLPKNPATTEP